MTHQKAESRKQKAEDRRQKAEGSSQQGGGASVRRKAPQHFSFCCLLPTAFCILLSACGIPKEMYVDATRERDALISENRRVTAERDELKTKVTKLEEELAGATNSKGALEEKVEKLAAEKKSATEDRDHLKKQVETLQNQVGVLTKDKQELVARVESLNSVIDSLKGTPPKP